MLPAIPLADAGIEGLKEAVIVSLPSPLIGAPPNVM